VKTSDKPISSTYTTNIAKGAQYTKKVGSYNLSTDESKTTTDAQLISDRDGRLVRYTYSGESRNITLTYNSRKEAELTIIRKLNREE
jgi:hypothetical protein